MKLVIVESPSKAKTIEKYLGKGYKVMASKGHIVDLPKSSMSIDIENNFTPQYEVKNAAVLSQIKKEFKQADSLVLAVDPDREGEAIAWHIARELKVIDNLGNKNKKNKKEVNRIVFTEITKDAVTKAINSPRDIDINLVNAQQTRRILDRLVGYKLSPLLWKKLMFGLSAGRVQSVALKLVVEKEDERNAFKSDEFWNIFSYLSGQKFDEPVHIKINKADIKEDIPCIDVEEKNCFKFTLLKVGGVKANVKKEKEALSIIENSRVGKWVIEDITSKVINRQPYPPFNTSTLQQSAGSVLGYSASRTMKIAQQLYEQGNITYMRTDSFNISQDAREAMRSYVVQNFGENYLPDKPRIYKTKSKVAQEAHEAIRPTHIEKKGADLKLTLDQKKLYDLIWKRALASQMADAKVESNKILVKVSDYIFGIDGQKTLFAGHYILKADKLKDIELPDFKKGQELFVLGMQAEQKFTEPPARYTEATLIKALEQFGIGRPSTYAPIITNISSRKYIEKDGKFLVPTLVGISLVRLLKDHFSDIINVEFTAEMEDDLDEIANGERSWVKTLSEFYKGFEKEILRGEKVIEKDKYNIVGSSDERCPICKGKMVIKLGRFSPFLSCKNFPKCKGIMSLNKKEEISIDVESDDFKSKYVAGPRTEDGRKYNFKKSRFGYFWAHPDYPKVKDARPLEYLPEINKQLFGSTPKDGKVKYVLRKGRFGMFWAHPDYPKIKKIKKIDMKEVRIKIKDMGLF